MGKQLGNSNEKGALNLGTMSVQLESDTQCPQAERWGGDGIPPAALQHGACCLRQLQSWGRLGWLQWVVPSLQAGW